MKKHTSLKIWLFRYAIGVTVLIVLPIMGILQLRKEQFLTEFRAVEQEVRDIGEQSLGSKGGIRLDQRSSQGGDTNGFWPCPLGSVVICPMVRESWLVPIDPPERPIDLADSIFKQHKFTPESPTRYVLDYCQTTKEEPCIENATRGDRFLRIFVSLPSARITDNIGPHTKTWTLVSLELTQADYLRKK